VLRWLEQHRPTVLAMQETQCSAGRFPKAGFEALGYDVHAHGDGGSNGVALAVRIATHDVVLGVPGAVGPFSEPRVVAVTIRPGPAPVRIICAYAPNGRKVGTDQHRYKLAWFKLLQAIVASAPEDEIVVAADLNVAPTDLDVWDADRYRNRNLTSPSERAAFGDLLADGLVDVVRAHSAGTRLSSWWNRRGDFFESDRGWRLDHVLATPKTAGTVASVRIDPAPRALAGCSDHAPVLVKFDSVDGLR
jgi:exodeoxyribonuclease III